MGTTPQDKPDFIRLRKTLSTNGRTTPLDQTSISETTSLLRSDLTKGQDNYQTFTPGRFPYHIQNGTTNGKGSRLHHLMVAPDAWLRINCAQLCMTEQDCGWLCMTVPDSEVVVLDCARTVHESGRLRRTYESG